MKLSDIAELLLLAGLWGGSFLLMRIAAPVLGPIWLIEIRVLMAGLMLLPILVRMKLLETLRQYLAPLLVVGAINSAIPFVLYAYAALSLPAGFTSILNATAPLFGTVVAAIWLQERPTSARLLGFGLGFVGVVILIGWQTDITATPAFLISVVAGLFAAVMYAIGAPFIKLHLSDVHPLIVTTGSQLSAALLLLPAVPFTVPTQEMTLQVAIATVILAVFSTAFAYILYFRLIRNIGSTRALTVTYLIPMFAMLWGALVLQEVITVSMVVGCGFVLVGTAIANDVLAGFLFPKAR
ncbi:MAG: DMT family transporter [Cyanobacteria bacterium P01_A01_bin.3]